MKTAVSSVFLLSLLAGCGSLEPMKQLTPAELSKEFSEMSGEYVVVDSRNNTSQAIVSISATIQESRGHVIVSRKGVRPYRLTLSRCEIANQAQAGNFGRPVEAIKSLVRCDIVSNYRYAQIYLGKVDAGYQVSDAKVFKTFEPMEIRTGRVVSLQENVGLSAELVVEKKL